jgi:putative inorganic carbon (HCO3(-)) transporter
MYPDFRFKHFLLYTSKIIIYVIPFLPLYIASSLMFPYITAKNFAFRILVEFACVFWLGLIATDREYRIGNSAILNSVLIFTFIIGLADLFGINPYNSFWSNYERMEGYITILHLVLFFLIIKSVFKTKNDWITFFSMYIIASILVNLFVTVEPLVIKKSSDYIMEYGTRRASTIGNPPFLASYLLLSGFLGLILAFMAQSNLLKLFSLLSVVINAIGIYLAASRGVIGTAILGMVLLGGLFFLRKRSKSDKKIFRNAVIFFSGLLITATVLVMLYRNFDFIQNSRTISRFKMVSLDDQSIKTRIDTWKIAWKGIKENPVLGWGQENFVGIYTVNPIPLGSKFVTIDRAHNIIIDWLVNAGILGLLSYLAIFGSVFYILWSYHKKKIISEYEVFIISATIILYFIQNLFTFDTINSYLIIFALIAYIDNIEIINVKDSFVFEKIKSGRTKIKSVSVTICAMIVCIVFTYHMNYIPVKQLMSYSHISRSLAKYGSFSTMLDDFDKALSYNSFGDDYIRTEMASVSRQIINYQLYKKEGSLAFIQRASEEIKKGLANNRFNLDYILNAINFYKLLSFYDPSFIPFTEMLINESMRLNPQYYALEPNRVAIKLLKKDYESAFEDIKRIITSNPDSDQLNLLYALSAILTLREEVVKEAIENIREHRIERNNGSSSGTKPILTVKELFQIANAYREVKNNHKALTYYKEIINILPEDRVFRSLREEDKLSVRARFHFKIAHIYKELGDKKKALKEVSIAAELDPHLITGEEKRL